MRRASPLLVSSTLGAVLAVSGPADAAVAPSQDDDVTEPLGEDIDVSTIESGDFIVDIEATILDLQATIVDVDGGTSTTESAEEVMVTLEADVFFDFDEHELRDDAVATLEGVADQIREHGATEVHIAGHTDSEGSDDYNQQLSEDRAAAVEAFLSDELDGVTMTTEGHGSSQPVAPNETEDGDDNPEGRALNRRVEITY